MPEYIFQHPKKPNKTVTLFMGMNDKHEYMDDKGVVWVRVWTVPAAEIDAKVDPYSEQQFVKKTGQGKGTMGDVYSRAEELSHLRASKNGGVDPKRQAYYDNYAKKRNGKRHAREKKEAIEKLVISI